MSSRFRRGTALLVPLALSAFLAACSQPAMTPSASLPADLSPPAHAAQFRAQGEYGTNAQLALAELQTQLRKEFPDGRWRVDWFTVPTDTAWPDLRAHYEHHLPAGWNGDNRFAERAFPGSRQHVWTDGQHHAFAIALLEDPLQGREPEYRILIVAQPKA